MKSSLEPCGPQGSEPDGTTVPVGVVRPWQSEQYIVCEPIFAVPFQGARNMLVDALMLRLAAVRPVLAITGCQDRWLPPGCPRSAIGAWNSIAWFVYCDRLFVPSGVPPPDASRSGRLPIGYRPLSRIGRHGGARAVAAVALLDDIGGRQFEEVGDAVIRLHAPGAPERARRDVGVARRMVMTRGRIAARAVEERVAHDPVRVVAIGALGMTIDEIRSSEQRPRLGEIAVDDVVDLLGRPLVAAVDRHAPVKAELGLDVLDLAAAIGDRRAAAVALVAGLLDRRIAA